MATPASAITGSRAPRPVQLYYAMRREGEMIEQLHREHGDVFRIHFERRPWFIVTHPDAIREVFTAPPDRRDAVRAAAQASATPVTRIGVIESAPGLRLVDAAGEPVTLRMQSFDHFA